MNKREEAVKRYCEDFLRDKSDEKRVEFFSKPLEKQYATIMAWKYRQDKHKEVRSRRPRRQAALTPADVLRHIRALPELIAMIDNMADKDFDPMYQALDEARVALNNYHATRQARIIARLEQERDAIQRKIDEAKGGMGID